MTYHVMELRSIDAWREHEGGWTWNASYQLESGIVFGDNVLTPRKILRALREWDFLSPYSKGLLRVVEEWPLIEIQEKNTGKPLLALMLEKTVED
jgi:hypothetical protein